MKKTFQLILAFAISACLTLPFTGCETYQNSENCGGIVKGYEYLCEKEVDYTFPQEGHYTAIQLEINFSEKSNKFYPYIIIVESFFDDYDCKSVEELFMNKDFIEAYSNAMVLEVDNGKALFEMNKAFVSNASVYFYKGFAEYKDLIKIKDFTNYIGYFNYN